METAVNQDYPHSERFNEMWSLMMELREEMKDTDRKMKETDRRIGELGNRFGELAEHLVAPSIMEKFNEKGFHFTRISNDVRLKKPGSFFAEAEVDIMLENDDVVIAVEVKAKPKAKDVEDHIARMEVLRRDADRRNDKRKYQGAVAGAIMIDNIRSVILQNGFYLIEQTGDTMKITMPEGFTPKDW